MADGGIVIRSADGTTYFIRDEILEACKVADDELAVTEAMVEESGEVSGFSLNFAQPVQLNQPNVSSQFNLRPNLDASGALNKQSSTVMCCW